MLVTSVAHTFSGTSTFARVASSLTIATQLVTHIIIIYHNLFQRRLSHSIFHSVPLCSILLSSRLIFCLADFFPTSTTCFVSEDATESVIDKMQQRFPSTPFTRYNRLSNRLYNRFDNRLYRVNKHPTGCQTGCQTGLTTGLTTVLTTGCIHDTTGC